MGYSIIVRHKKVKIRDTTESGINKDSFNLLARERPVLEEVTVDFSGHFVDVGMVEWRLFRRRYGLS